VLGDRAVAADRLVRLDALGVPKDALDCESALLVRSSDAPGGSCTAMPKMP
jgi:hypothetical protein